MSPAGEADPAYVRARSALFDALEALGPQRAAVILVGAQAIYFHVGEAAEALSSFTTDADLALNPAKLTDEPAIEDALSRFGFERRDQPGLWFSPSGIEVDLLVPASIAGAGRRGADLGPSHERTAAMRAAGLEAALIDNSPHRLMGLDPNDDRSFVVSIAGPAALLVAKLHKVAERNDRSSDRLKNKDASDIWLLLRAFESEVLGKNLKRLRAVPESASATQVGLDALSSLFTTHDAMGIVLLRAAVEGLEDEAAVEASCIALAKDLLEVFERDD